MSSVKKNFAYQTAYQILTMLLPLITSPYLARVIGAEGVGINSYTYAIVSYFVLVAKLGMHVYGNRAIATVRDDREKLSKTFWDIYSLHATVSGIVIVVYIVFLFVYGGEYKIIFLIQGLYIIGQLVDVNWLFFGLEKFKITVTRNTIIKLLTVACIFIFVKEQSDLIKYIFILAFGSALSESVVWIFVRRYVDFVVPDIKTWKGHLFPMSAFLITSAAVSIYKMMDKVMLGAMSNTLQVGLYENSEKIISISLGFVTALGTVMLPRMTNLVATGKERQLKNSIKKSSGFALILSYCICFGIIGVSGIFPTVYWGQEFSPCSALMVGLAFSIIPCAIANVARTQYLLPKRMDKTVILAVCVGAVVNLIVNGLCIPKLEAMGAVIGTIVAETVVCAIQLIAVRKYIPFFNYIVRSIPYAVLGAAEAVLVWLIGCWRGLSVVTLMLQVISGGAFFVISACFILYITKDELLNSVSSVFKQILRKKLK